MSEYRILWTLTGITAAALAASAVWYGERAFRTRTRLAAVGLLGQGDDDAPLGRAGSRAGRCSRTAPPR